MTKQNKKSKAKKKQQDNAVIGVMVCTIVLLAVAAFLVLTR